MPPRFLFAWCWLALASLRFRGPTSVALLLWPCLLAAAPLPPLPPELASVGDPHATIVEIQRAARWEFGKIDEEDPALRLRQPGAPYAPGPPRWVGPDVPQDQRLWLRWQVGGPTWEPGDYIIEVRSTLAQDIVFLGVVAEDGVQEPMLVATGAGRPYGTRLLPARTFAFPITVTRDRTVPVYLGLAGYVGETLPEITLSRSHVWWSGERQQAVWLAACLAVVVVLGSTQVGLAMAKRSAGSWWLAGSALAAALMVASWAGLLFAFVWPGAPSWQMGTVAGFGLLALGLHCWNVRSFLAGELFSSPRRDGVLAAVGSITLVLGAAAFFQVPSSSLMPYNAGWALLVLVTTTLVVAVRCGPGGGAGRLMFAAQVTAVIGAAMVGALVLIEGRESSAVLLVTTGLVTLVGLLTTTARFTANSALLHRQVQNLEVEVAAQRDAMEQAVRLAEENKALNELSQRRSEESVRLERERAEAVANAEVTSKRLQSLVEDAPMALLVVQQDTGKVTQTNARAEELLRLSRDEIINMPLRRAFPKDQGDLVWRAVQEQAEPGEPLPGKWQAQRTGAGAEPVPVEVLPVPAPGREGVLWHLYLRDLSDRVAATAESLRQQALITFLADYTQAWVAVVDGQKRIVHWNQAAAVTSGFSPDDARRLGWAGLFNALFPEMDQRHAVQRQMGPALVTPGAKAVRCEVTLLARTQEKKLLQWQVVPLPEVLGFGFGFAVFGLELTRIKQLEGLVNEARSEGENARRELNRLRAAFDAQQKRLDSLAGTLVRRLGEGVDASGGMAATGKDGARLLGELLAADVAAQAVKPGESDSCELSALIQTVYETASPASARAGLELQWQPTEKARIKGDAERLRSTLLALVWAVCALAPAGRKLRLKIERVASGSAVRWSITDPAGGLPAEDVAAFFTVGAKLTTPVAQPEFFPTLGLPSAKATLEAHGARVRLDTAGVGRGLAVVVSFSVVEE